MLRELQKSVLLKMQSFICNCFTALESTLTHGWPNNLCQRLVWSLMCVTFSNWKTKGWTSYTIDENELQHFWVERKLESDAELNLCESGVDVDLDSPLLEIFDMSSLYKLSLTVHVRRTCFKFFSLMRQWSQENSATTLLSFVIFDTLTRFFAILETCKIRLSISCFGCVSMIEIPIWRRLEEMWFVARRKSFYWKEEKNHYLLWNFNDLLYRII